MRPGPGPDWAPLCIRRWVAQDLHRTLTTAADHLTGRHCDTGALVEDLRYHAGMLSSRLAEPATRPTTVTDEDPI
ncbi:hypothetical protein AB0C10_21155 [Microbispora amethystogenes]|uniref:hypothetical protein n=1 Tax=Microbispora amethystogenes TaxID=1427754 RepID=UPI0033DCBD35